MSAHYDISNEMFAGTCSSPSVLMHVNQNALVLAFLSEDMTYSCAIFADLDGDMKSGVTDRGEWSGGQGLKRIGTQLHSESAASPSEFNDELHDGQLRKLNHIIRQAKILPGHRVLEIGSGWGSLAILLTQTIPGTTVDTITLSIQQQALAVRRIKAAGLEDRINVHLMDYRNMPEGFKHAFDRVVSIEMIEAVGAEFLEKYWSVVDWAMKEKCGVGVVQVITIPEPSKRPCCIACRTLIAIWTGFERYIREIDFIRKWVRFLSEYICSIHIYLLFQSKSPSYLRMFPTNRLPSLSRRFPPNLDSAPPGFRERFFQPTDS